MKRWRMRQVDQNSTESSRDRSRRLRSVTPGELLEEEFLSPMGVTTIELGKKVGIPSSRIKDILQGKSGIDANTDLRLCRYFGLTDGYWLRAQVAHDLEVEQLRIAKDLQKIKPLKRAKTS